MRIENIKMEINRKKPPKNSYSLNLVNNNNSVLSWEVNLSCTFIRSINNSRENNRLFVICNLNSQPQSHL